MRKSGAKARKPAGMKIPIIRPSLPDPDGLAPQLAAMWESGQVTSGMHVRALEEAVCRKIGVRHAVAVSSCTSGLILAVKALGLSGEVILPAFTFAATAHALVWNGISPVFCDSEPGTLNLDPGKAERCITGRTSAIMPVSIFGVPPRVAEFQALARRRGLKLLYDSAQALGAKVDGAYVGGFGDAEAFSLSPTKVVTAIEGGLVTTDDDALAKRIRQMRDYGKADDGEDMEFVGLSARMSELHAAVGVANFARMDALIRRRGSLVARYGARLSGLAGIAFQEVPAGVASSRNYMVILVDGSGGVTREELYARLKQDGIQTKRYFHPAVHQLTAYRRWGRRYLGKLPVAEKAAREGLALPLYGDLRPAEVDAICDRIREIFGAA